MLMYDIFTHTLKRRSATFFYARRSRTLDFQHPIKIVMEGEVEADVGLMGDVATIDDGPQLPSSPERAHSGVCDPTRSSSAVSQMAEKGRNDVEAQDERAQKGTCGKPD